MNKIIILNMPLADIETLVVGLGEPKFRAKQIADWLARGVADFAEMKNLPASLREKLAAVAQPLPCKIVKTLTSSDGNTHKLLLSFGDKTLIESVVMKTRYGNSVCVSSQSGCAMGCKFCASTLLGLDRNLTATEMLAQVAAAQSILQNDRISHVVIMGSGEPLQNFDNVIEFMERLNETISWRKITLSTCGITEGINRLAQWGKPINLALSLHAPTDELRSQIMPINKAYPLTQTLAALDIWQAATKRQLTFEYIVLGGVNDSVEHAEQLADLVGARDVFVNLIPYNPVSEREFSAPSNNAVHRIKEVLERRKIPCAVRFERGKDINSACGQLRNNNL